MSKFMILELNRMYGPNCIDTPFIMQKLTKPTIVPRASIDKGYLWV